MPFAAAWMDVEMIILSVVIQRKTNIIWDHKSVDSNNNNKKMFQKNLQTRNRLEDCETKSAFTKGEMQGGRVILRNWDWHIYITIYEIDRQLGPTV